jgi:hypothetical protein
MAHMLVVAARQFCHPVALVVAMITDDGMQHVISAGRACVSALGGLVVARYPDPFAVRQVTDMGGNENPFDHALGFAHGESLLVGLLNIPPVTLILAGAAINTALRFRATTECRYLST